MRLQCVGFYAFVELKLKKVLTCHWLNSDFVHLSLADPGQCH
jgi:hypothetical protein